MASWIFVVGTRAQLVKVAPVLVEAHSHGVDHVVWFTGQHKESIADLVQDFGLASQFLMPAVHKERSTIAALARWLPVTFGGLVTFLWRQRRHSKFVLVHGDTLSAVIGAIAARLVGLRVVHIESGLTSGKLLDPFPEEFIRRATVRFCDVAFCPNPSALAFCERRKIRASFNTGQNTLLDSVRVALKRNGAVIEDSGYFVASIHRFQNIYDAARLTKIVEDMCQIAELGRLEFVMHPATMKQLQRHSLLERLQSHSSLVLRPRCAYTEFLGLLAGARAVLSDGGSNQEELAYLGIPTILYRDRSERPDGLGQNVVLVGDLHMTVPNFLASAQLGRLRRPAVIFSDTMPSRSIVRALLDIRT